MKHSKSLIAKRDELRKEIIQVIQELTKDKTFDFSKDELWIVDPLAERAEENKVLKIESGVVYFFFEQVDVTSIYSINDLIEILESIELY